MCKLVGKIGKIPQYEFCEEYKNAKTKKDIALINYDTAKYLKETTVKEFNEILKKHIKI